MCLTKGCQIQPPTPKGAHPPPLKVGKLRHGEGRQQGLWLFSLLPEDISLPVPAGSRAWIHPTDGSWLGWRPGRSRRGVGAAFLPGGEQWLSLAGTGPTQTLPCGKQHLDAVCHLGEVAAAWLAPVQAQLGLSPAQSPAELWGSRKAATELIYTWFTPCCCPDPLAQSRAVSRRVALPTCRHSPAHCSAGLPLITLRAEGLTAAILFPATLQMIQHNKTYNSPLEKRKL